MTELVKYEAACRALAEAVTVDEVKEFFNKADAIRVYARQAKNKKLENDAKMIRWRAIRRMGEIMEESPKARGGKPYHDDEDTGGKNPPVKTLDESGVDKDLAKLARKYAAMEGNSFDRLVERCKAHNDGTEKFPLDILAAEDKAAADAKRKADHAAKTFNGGKIEDLHALAASGFKAKAILADPAWQFIARSDKGEGRSASQHYDVQGLEAIKALPIKQLAADDCCLFMWMLDWCPKWAMEVIEAWGFEHKTTAFTWVKLTANHDGQPRYDGLISDRDFHFGQGYWTRANPEDCWLSTRGSPKRINADVRQLIIHPVMEHSRKPDDIHGRIERLVDGPYLELNARREVENWLTWGNEIEFKPPSSTLADDGSPTDQHTGEIIGEAAE